LLDSISLTAIMTDPSPRTAPERGEDARGLLAAVSPMGEIRLPQPETAARQRYHELTSRKLLKTVAVGVGAVLLLSVGLVAGGVIGSTSAVTPPPHATTGGPQATRLAVHATHLDLPLAVSPPAPAPPSVALNSTAPHEVFAYAPYWSLPQSSSFPVEDFSTIAYFSVDVNANGSIQQSGPGWDGYESQNLVDLITRAHQAGVRVVLTATDFSQSSLDTLTHSPGAADVLGTSLLELVQTKGLDGVNLDLEGVGSSDQAGLDRLVAHVGFIMRLADPHYQVTMATYASSASDPSGFYDIPGLAPSVDAFFVMAYDVSQGTVAQADGNGGGVDAGYIAKYTSAVPASKVILGVPLFGYDMPTSGPNLGDGQTGPAQPVPYAQAMSSGPTYWDAATGTAWTSYQSGGQWHQVYFDNANSLALKEQLVTSSNLLGIGVWALGMEGSDESVLSVLDGGSPPQRLPPVGPADASAAAVGPTANSSGTAAGSTGGGGAPASAPRGHRRAGAGGTQKATTTTTEAAATRTTSTSSSTTTTASKSSASTTTTTPPTVPSTTTTTIPPGGTTITTPTTITSGP